MASAVHVPAVTRVVETEKIVLELSPEEASAISQVFARVAGHPDHTRRGLVDEVQRALEDAGVTRHRYNSPSMDLEGEVKFF